MRVVLVEDDLKIVTLYDATKIEWMARIDKLHHFCKVRIVGD